MPFIPRFFSLALVQAVCDLTDSQRVVGLHFLGPNAGEVSTTRCSKESTDNPSQVYASRIVFRLGGHRQTVPNRNFSHLHEGARNKNSI